MNHGNKNIKTLEFNTDLFFFFGLLPNLNDIHKTYKTVTSFYIVYT